MLCTAAPELDAVVVPLLYRETTVPYRFCTVVSDTVVIGCLYDSPRFFGILVLNAICGARSRSSMGSRRYRIFVFVDYVNVLRAALNVSCVLTHGADVNLII